MKKINARRKEINRLKLIIGLYIFSMTTSLGGIIYFLIKYMQTTIFECKVVCVLVIMILIFVTKVVIDIFLSIYDD